VAETLVIDRFYAALCAGDLAAAQSCFAEDAYLWHSFDGTAQDLATAAAGWADLIAASGAREIHDIRRHETADGLVQQHVFVMTTPTGDRLAWPVCLVLRIERGRIVRLDEYIDRAGSFVAAGHDHVATPGMPTIAHPRAIRAGEAQ
jgi:ketosteroid isomerase-like protein